MKSARALILLTALSATAVYADVGVCKFGNETVDTVTCIGPAVLDGTTVTGKVVVTGPLKANNAHMNSIQVIGPATITNSQVAGDMNITGPIALTSTTINGAVTVTSNSADLEDSIINGPFSMDSNLEKPNINMVCDSQINGAVSFTVKPGVISLSDKSAVTGTVSNGQQVPAKASQTCQ